MPDKKISQLTSAGALTGVEPLPIVQDGSTVKTTVQDIANLAPTTPTASLLVTASVIDSTITFIKGDGTTFDVTTVAPTASLLVTASAIGSTITFIKGDGSNFDVTVAGGSGTPGGEDTMIQYNSGSSFGATGSFKFIYDSQSLENGFNVTASGMYSHAEGHGAEAIGYYSHAEGSENYAIGYYSHAEGDSTFSIGTYSHAEGQAAITSYRTDYIDDTMAGNKITLTYSGDYRKYFPSQSNIVVINDDFTLAFYDVISTTGSYDGTYTTLDFLNNSNQYISYIVNKDGAWTGGNSGYSHAEGQQTMTAGVSSHAEGTYTKAFGPASHAEGAQTLSSGSYSHAEGTYTRAFGVGSHAEGTQTTAIGDYSHAAGLNTVSSGAYQSVIGRYNVSSSAQSAFIIGNGISDGTRSNLLFASSSQVQITGSLTTTGSLKLIGDLSITGSLVITGSFVLPTQSGSATVSYPSNPAPGTMFFYTSGSSNEIYIYNGSDWRSVGVLP
jgi:hypothetical protein